MARYEKCNKFDGLCPCLRCTNMFCRGCFAERRKDGVRVDTDLLCSAAKEYCEKGRD